MMTVRYTRADFLRLGMYVAPRMPALRWWTLFVAVMIFTMNMHQQAGHWRSGISLFATLATTAIFTIGYYLFVLVALVLSAVLRNGKGSPAQEPQTFALTELGLSRRSPSSEMLLKWGGARSLFRSRSAIYVGVSKAAYFILPRRLFAADEEYESVWKDLQKLLPQGVRSQDSFVSNPT